MSADQDDRRSAEEKNGAVRTMVGEVLASAKPGEGEQLALLPADDAEAVLPTKAGPGRPPGARNKATEELRAWVRGRFGDPGLKLMEWAFADPAAEARRLGAESAWAVRVKQAEWMQRMLPFFWQQMPAEVKLAAKSYLAIGISAAPGSVKAGDQALNIDPLSALLGMQENQPLSVTVEHELHAEVSHVAPTPDEETKG